MTPRRRHSEEFLQDITVDDDGIRPVRTAMPWSRDKLGILQAYLPAFAKACKRKAPEFYFVDGLSGPGLYNIKDTSEFLLGSTQIALNVDPEFARCISMDSSNQNIRALTKRAELSSARASILQGDCNQDLLPAIRDQIPDWAPLFVFLDPEGFEVDWETVEGIAAFKKSQYKAEQLLLAPTGGVHRVAAVEDELVRDNLRRSMPRGSLWEDIWNRRLESQLSAEEARTELAEQYRRGLQRIGYEHVLVRPITRQTVDDASVYHLVFATDNQAGHDIMRDVFENMYSNQRQFKLPGF